MNNQSGGQRYIFVYGGTDEVQVKKFKELMERINRDMISLSQGRLASIVHIEIPEASWDDINKNFQYKILNRNDEDDDVLFEMEMLLAMKNEKSWALFSKGVEVLVVDYNPLIYDTLEEFENWKIDILEQGFEKAFIDYYHKKRSKEFTRHCYHFQLENFSITPQNLICPEPACRLKMKTKSIQYECYHKQLNQRLIQHTSEKNDDEATQQL